jgi:hypothetical protein
MAQLDAFKLPEGDLGFWELFDHFWVRGLGNTRHEDGTAEPWSALTLADALDGSPDKRSIENWQSHKNMPSPDNLRKISMLIAPENNRLRKQWYDAFVDARLKQKRVDKVIEQKVSTSDLSSSQNSPRKLVLVSLCAALLIGGIAWFMLRPVAPLITDMRICDAVYFDTEMQKCTKHVDVFVHGVDEVFLSFDFNGVEYGEPFERWWIHNGERVAGRSSFNDDAWPGYTFWRPGELELGQYVVRLVVEGEVTTQTFYVQAEGFT